MSYRIQVTRLVKNAEYAEQMKAWKQEQPFRGGLHLGGSPPSEIMDDVSVLLVELTDEQYEAVKKAVLETWR